jgi:hypothetical protein
MSEVIYTNRAFRGLDAFRLVRTLLLKGYNKRFNEGLKGGSYRSFSYRIIGCKALSYNWMQAHFLKGEMDIVGGE